MESGADAHNPITPGNKPEQLADGIMDNLDEKINTLIRDKQISLIQENTVRIKRITVKFTKTNKKHTLDHWQVYYDSYDRMFRSIPKDLCRIEREVRIKFVSALTPKRIEQLKTIINSEAEVLFEKMANACQAEFEKLGSGDLFAERVEQTRKKFSENLEQHIQKCVDGIHATIGGGQRAGVQELTRLYEVKESLLYEINIITPLQKINALLSQVNGDTRLSGMMDGLQEGFRELFQDLQEVHTNNVDTKEARKALKMDVARDAMTVREIITNTQPFLEQLVLPVDRRNFEVIQKSWERFFDTIEVQGERWKKVIPHFTPLYQFMCGEGN